MHAHDSLYHLTCAKSHAWHAICIIAIASTTQLAGHVLVDFEKAA